MPECEVYLPPPPPPVEAEPEEEEEAPALQPADAGNGIVQGMCSGNTNNIGNNMDYACPGETTGFLKPFIYKNDHFTKTGSGQT
jgi:hypothetical protein